ncbi:hypothetical protein SAMN02745126_04963 [Enhydrobacter aerosaccus]|uniref:O-antigen ligase like membrane protein n=1 Tax=Enhydrobacter aerosaccus TaxID=225324 RepID=A0A1T4SQ63_9HYPH|nr:hypothetical protein [Enhydrobacter aerosaccus]SKA30420.1 hypothetical protein SAMN02745126_04963 [Enhydrobacter aerosaccus]
MSFAATLSGARRRLDALDTALFVLYLVGLYLGVSLQITSTIPLTCAPSGVAGLLMLWRRRDQLQSRELAGLLLVVGLYLASILSAADLTFLPKRFTGLLQLVYSLVIGYAMFMTMTSGDRDQIAAILLGFCVFIIIGCLLEEYGGLRALSDKVREHLYDAGAVYDADRRDELLYGRIRPKLFTSEPSAVTFAYTQYSSIWLVVSRSRWKFAIYFGLVAMALVVLPGPTLMLMLLLAIPYIMFLAGGARRASVSRMFGAAIVSSLVVLVAVVVGQTLFAARLHQLQAGQDASFFYRFTGPMLLAFDMFRHHPWAGSGLTGELSIASDVMNVYMNSASFSSAWRIPKVADVITNYFWQHWIYLGLVWGVVVTAGLSLWLRWLGAASILYCWSVWAILGQASGAYVGPKTWAVLLIAAAASVMVARAEAEEDVPMPRGRTEPWFVRRRYPQFARSAL